MPLHGTSIHDGVSEESIEDLACVWRHLLEHGGAPLTQLDNTFG